MRGPSQGLGPIPASKNEVLGPIPEAKNHVVGPIPQITCVVIPKQHFLSSGNQNLLSLGSDAKF